MIAIADKLSQHYSQGNGSGQPNAWTENEKEEQTGEQKKQKRNRRT